MALQNPDHELCTPISLTLEAFPMNLENPKYPFPDRPPEKNYKVETLICYPTVQQDTWQGKPYRNLFFWGLLDGLNN